MQDWLDISVVTAYIANHFTYNLPESARYYAWVMQERLIYIKIWTLGNPVCYTAAAPKKYKITYTVVV